MPEQRDRPTKPLKLTVRLLVFDTDVTDGTKSIRDIKEQEIYFGTIP